MPFKLTEMLVISSADGANKNENPNNDKWNLDVNQYNDIYMKFSKNSEYKKTAYIESVTVENINITNPNIGEVIAYMPSSTDGKLFSYDENYIVNSSLTYKGSNKDNTKTLEISNQGGMVVFRLANRKVSEYVSNSDDEVSYDGKLLKKTGANEADLQFNVSFDVIIKTDSNKYRTKLNIELPCGDIETEGTSKIYDNELKDVVFKRVN